MDSLSYKTVNHARGEIPKNYQNQATLWASLSPDCET